ncbi:MAG: integrase core domain-containing protein [Caldilineales bacterium]|nr:integrase core domain-containing protein [Caldilineales bacterium]
MQLAKDNTRWGYGKIAGELQKLGFDVCESTVRNVLKAYDILPAPVRFGSIGWRTLMRHYKHQLLACDFFTVETLRLQTLYVFFFIELGTRRVHVVGVTANPDGHWVTQQARNMVWLLQEEESPIRSLLRENDSKYAAAFDAVFAAESVNIIRLPYQAPNANAICERYMGTLHRECLDHMIILKDRHLDNVIQDFSTFYNHARPHQGLCQYIPM